jgi:hypothetical protein
MRSWQWQPFVRVLLGTGLVLHGLGNAVLPLRGADAIAPGTWMPFMTALYVVAIVGFVAAGLGVLGVPLLRRVSAITVFAAGAAALGAQLWQGDTDLWPGMMFSVTLPVATILHAAFDDRGLHPLPARSPWHRVGTVVGWAFLAWIAVSAATWPWHRSWGTTPAEWNAALAGDRAPRTPAFEIFHGITIDAPPSDVWPWLVQIGQDRAGFYSYAWLERLFLADIRNADRIHPEWQALRAGERVHATQSGYMGGVFGQRPGWIVELVEPGHALVLRYWGAFVLQPLPGNRTRLLIRSTVSNRRIPVWGAALNFAAFELPHFIMQRRMMLGIKQRAERTIA